VVDYDKCNPGECNSETGKCVAVSACTHKVLSQMDGPFEQPVVFYDTCMGCWDCIEACPLDAIKIKHIS
jgi:translation initiation factor RLI1